MSLLTPYTAKPNARTWDTAVQVNNFLQFGPFPTGTYIAGLHITAINIVGGVQRIGVAAPSVPILNVAQWDANSHMFTEPGNSDLVELHSSTVPASSYLALGHTVTSGYHWLTVRISSIVGTARGSVSVVAQQLTAA